MIERVGPVHERLVDPVELVGGVHLGDRARPGAGVGALRVVALAGAKPQVAQPDEPRLAAVRGGVGERRFEQRVGGRIARVLEVHHGGGDAGDANRPRLAHRRARQRVRGVRLLVAPAGRRQVDPQPAVLDPQRVARHLVVLEARLALAGAMVELPEVPRADDVVAVQAALAERPADVVADAGNGPEAAVAAGDGELRLADHDLLQPAARDLLGGADVGPFGIRHRFSFRAAAMWDGL